ncbi:hypothetical protein BJ508DRAFT_307863 [Ascobolus immersus RN42]|uniref:Uncharacterized protein n=1 Tax=Ascobolus immersus RN42 TaxID=1160509 RepID=A0A3N4I5K1_ASCIM|nr:hypothetical protein BJ508DRAFT_307863 [Ascobolus immersus RN42]
MLYGRDQCVEHFGPYTQPCSFLTDAGINYVIWGYYCLGFCFGFRQYLSLDDLDIVVADDEMPDAIKTLQKHSYQLSKKPKVGMFGMMLKVGEFPEIAVLNFCGSEKTCLVSVIPRPVNLIPASLVHFRLEVPYYRRTSKVELPMAQCNSLACHVWTVHQPTLPGILDAALTTMRLNARRSEDLKNPFFGVKFYLKRECQELPMEELRKESLFQHGREIWSQITYQAYGRKHRFDHPMRGELPSPRQMKVAALLGDVNCEYYTFLCVDEDIYEDIRDEERAADEDDDSSDSEGWDSDEDAEMEAYYAPVLNPREPWENHFGIIEAE